jgi:hypothetical protein
VVPTALMLLPLLDFDALNQLLELRRPRLLHESRQLLQDREDVHGLPRALGCADPRHYLRQLLLEGGIPREQARGLLVEPLEHRDRALRPVPLLLLLGGELLPLGIVHLAAAVSR